MNKRIVFRGVEHSDLIEEHANKQLQKIEKFTIQQNSESIKVV